MIIAHTSDSRKAARHQLQRFQFEYKDGGSYGEVTLRRNAIELTETHVAMPLTGVTNVAAINRSILIEPQGRS